MTANRPPRTRPTANPRALALAALASLAALAGACTGKKAPPRPEPPLPTVATSSTSPFVLARGGTDPAFKTADGALWVFVQPGGGGEGAERPLAGIGLGDAKGPRYGLLSGTFAPLLAALDSTRAYPVAIATTKDGVVASFGAELAVLVRPPQDGRATIVVRGPAALVVPADRTEVRATLHGAPALAVQVSAGDAPEVLAPKADRLELTPRGRPAIALDTSCPPRVVRPVPRGSTSVFVVHLGGDGRALADPLFGVDRAQLDGSPQGASGVPRVEPCTGTVTTTVSVPWPLAGP